MSDQLFVVRTDISNALWVVYRTEASCSCRKVTDRLCIGDNSSARFLPYHLWDARNTVSELEKLAVLTLSYAHIENPTSVGPPFDVMTLDRQGNIRWDVYDFQNDVYAQFDRRLREPL